MSRSHQSLSFSWLLTLRMLDKAVWAFVQRKVHHTTLVENNEITDQRPNNTGIEYTEYVFSVMSYIPTFYVCYVRIWLRHKKSNVPRIERVLITNSKAEVLGEWDGTAGPERSFEVFLEGINRLSLQYLDELLQNRPPLAPYSRRAVQKAWMHGEVSIIQQEGDVVIVQTIDTNLNRPVAEIKLRGAAGHYWAETIKVYESLSIEVVSTTYHHSAHLWTNESQ